MWMIIGSVAALIVAFWVFAHRAEEDETMIGTHNVRIRRHPKIYSTHHGYALAWNVRDILYLPNRAAAAARDNQ